MLPHTIRFYFETSKLILESPLNRKKYATSLDSFKRMVAEYNNLDLDQFNSIESDKYKSWVTNHWTEAIYFHEFTKNISFVDSGQETELEDKQKVLKSYDSSKLTFYKSYDTLIKLEKPTLKPLNSLGKSIIERRTTRVFSDEKISLSELSYLLFTSSQPLKLLRDFAINSTDKPLVLTLSSYAPCELYFYAHNVEGVDQGIYHYNIKEHGISQILSGDFSKKMQTIAIGQGVNKAPLIFLISNVFERYMWRYRNSRAYRNLLIETSSFAQRLILSSSSISINTFMTPALRDSIVDDLLSLDGFSESVSYLVACGK